MGAVGSSEALSVLVVVGFRKRVVLWSGGVGVADEEVSEADVLKDDGIGGVVEDEGVVFFA
jgi:hypothetical protein